MLTVAQFRKLVLAMPDAVEGAHMGHPDFRAQGRVFASLYPDGERAMVKVSVVDQRELLAAHPAVFSPASGAWGRAGCTVVQLATATAKVVQPAIVSAWNQAQVQPPRRKAPTRKQAKR